MLLFVAIILKLIKLYFHNNQILNSDKLHLVLTWLFKHADGCCLTIGNGQCILQTFIDFNIAYDVVNNTFC